MCISKELLIITLAHTFIILMNAIYLYRRGLFCMEKNEVKKGYLKPKKVESSSQLAFQS